MTTIPRLWRMFQNYLRSSNWKWENAACTISNTCLMLWTKGTIDPGSLLLPTCSRMFPLVGNVYIAIETEFRISHVWCIARVPLKTYQEVIWNRILSYLIIKELRLTNQIFHCSNRSKKTQSTEKYTLISDNEYKTRKLVPKLSIWVKP